MEKGMLPFFVVKGHHLCLLLANCGMKCCFFRSGDLAWYKQMVEMSRALWGSQSLFLLLNYDLCVRYIVWSCQDFSLWVEKRCACALGFLLVTAVTLLVLSAGLEPNSVGCSASDCACKCMHCWGRKLFFLLCKKEVRTTTAIFLFCFPDPIPGGCNLEFDLEVDPNIYLDYTLVEVHIKFAPANLGYMRCVVKK